MAKPLEKPQPFSNYYPTKIIKLDSFASSISSFTIKIEEDMGESDNLPWRLLFLLKASVKKNSNLNVAEGRCRCSSHHISLIIKLEGMSLYLGWGTYAGCSTYAVVICHIDFILV